MSKMRKRTAAGARSRRTETVSWSVFQFRSRLERIGTVEAPPDDEQAAIAEAVRLYEIRPELQGRISVMRSD